MLTSQAECRRYLEEQPPAVIARQLRHDHELCQSLKLPSLLALYLPRSGSDLGFAVAKELSNASIAVSIRALQYNSIIKGIKAYLHVMVPVSKHEPLPVIGTGSDNQPTKNELEAALKVLDYCTKNDTSITVESAVGDVVSMIKNMLNSGTARDEDLESFRPEPKKDTSGIEHNKKVWRCYICRFRLSNPHPQYPSLCKPCGDFNLASCNISMPNHLRLNHKKAFVTGGRINLGYHTALRLLRCGAHVIVSTRYPRDAEARYLSQKDSGEWYKRLKIIGADFRAASDVFELISLVKRCLEEWCDGAAKLDILVNNAAQTLTDPLDTEKRAVERESSLQVSGPQSSTLLPHGNYEPRIRGGVKTSELLESTGPLLQITAASNENEGNTGTPPSRALVEEGRFKSLAVAAPTPTKSSWVQSINQIPYEDVISAHSVNTFVPLILIRELLPLMGSITTLNIPSSAPPLGYILNVSSREGIFEVNPASSAKNGHHVHTNLTKAALNMLTETEASPAWKARRVAMNTIDPGYMSAAPEIVDAWRNHGREGCPIGWEDGVGRVLWPVAVCENGEPVWGRFLKHFGKVEVEVGVGR